MKNTRYITDFVRDYSAFEKKMREDLKKCQFDEIEAERFLLVLANAVNRILDKG